MFGQWSRPVYVSTKIHCLPSSAIRLKYNYTALGKEIPCEPLSPKIIASGISNTAPVPPARREYHANRTHAPIFPSLCSNKRIRK